jgi:hypothetical protein
MRFCQRVVAGIFEMKKYLKSALAIALLSNSFSSYAYDPVTHQKISAQAFSASTLANDPMILDSMGLPPLATNPTFPNSVYFPEQKTINELFEDGAKFEDDFPRSINHFFNPLTGLGLFSGSTASPDWAIDGTGDYSSVKYSFDAARQYFYTALTDPGSISYRQTQFGLMFRSLGQVIHHIQDMAQPQHVRGDAHCDILPCNLIGKYNPSLYEQYTKSVRNLPYTGYDPVYSDADTTTFNVARKFWTTTVKDNSGKGIAEYTNRGFVSAGTNFKGSPTNIQAYPNLPKPNGEGAGVITVDLSDPVQKANLDAEFPGNPLPASWTGQIQFITTPVVDNYRSSTTTPRTSTFSIFDADLTSANQPAAFALNRFNFKDAQDLLIPRAVGYSAGLINNFFRGKIDMVRVPDGKFAIQNLGPETMTGDFSLYYDAADGTRYPVSGASWPNLTISAGNQSDPLTFTAPSSPAPATAGEYMLVFKGDMGEEKHGVNSIGEADSSIGAVAAKKVNFPCRTLSIDMTPGVPQYIWPTLTATGGDYQYGNSIGTSTCSGSSTVRANWVGGNRTIYANGVQIYNGTDTAWSYYSGGSQLGGGLIYNGFPSVPTYLNGVPGYYVTNGEYSTYNSCAGGSVINTTSTWVPVTQIPNPDYTGQPQTIVHLSDGTQIASFPYTVIDSYWHKANYPIDTNWTGNPWIDLYTDTNDGNGNWTPVFSQQVPINVPPDVCHP